MIVLAVLGIAIGAMAWLFGPDHLETTGLSGLSGKVRIVDGDSIIIKGNEIRLFGIDAMEGRQTCTTRAGKTQACGKRARTALARLIGKRSVTCQQIDMDRYGRIIARCRVAKLDINQWMAAHGHALAYRRYSQDYVEAEEKARAEKRGIWRTEFVPPWVWRAQNR